MICRHPRPSIVPPAWVPVARKSEHTVLRFLPTPNRHPLPATSPAPVPSPRPSPRPGSPAGVPPNLYPKPSEALAERSTPIPNRPQTFSATTLRIYRPLFSNGFSVLMPRTGITNHSKSHTAEPPCRTRLQPLHTPAPPSFGQPPARPPHPRQRPPTGLPCRPSGRASLKLLNLRKQQVSQVSNHTHAGTAPRLGIPLQHSPGETERRLFWVDIGFTRRYDSML